MKFNFTYLTPQHKELDINFDLIYEECLPDKFDDENITVRDVFDSDIDRILYDLYNIDTDLINDSLFFYHLEEAWENYLKQKNYEV